MKARTTSSQKCLFYLRKLGFVYNYTLHALGNTCEHFVGNGVAGLCVIENGVITIEYNGFIAFLCRDSCNVDHGNVHAHATDNGTGFSVDEDFAFSVGERSAEAICVADRKNGDFHFLVGSECSSVTNGFIRKHRLDLDNTGF